MESNKQSRVLAYNMAKEISENELKDVSGGGWMTHRYCQQMTGATGQMDFVVDFVMDW